MTYACKILTDSITIAGHRLTTFQITFPRFILAEVNTHRILSKSSASSRAIPVEKRIEQIQANPFVPEAFAANKRGMQAGDDLHAVTQKDCRRIWLDAVGNAVASARELESYSVHKQWANRLLEPFAWNTAIVTGTEWANYFALRAHKDAQPEFRTIAAMMREQYETTVPRILGGRDWHLPLVGEAYGDDPVLVRAGPENFVKVSVARCARISHLTHDGVRDPEADLKLYGRLATHGHMSPLEHPARPMTHVELSLAHNGFCGNFRGWVQHRKEIPGEDVFTGGAP